VRSLWLRIGLGAAAVFVLGMMAITLFQDARAAAKSALLNALGAGARVTPAAEALAAHFRPTNGMAETRGPVDMPFRLDGKRLGTIHHLTIRRAEQGAVPDIDLIVTLTDPARSARLADCDLVPMDRDANVDRGFTCVDGHPSGLVMVGSVRFQPLGIRRPLWVTETAATGMRQGDPFEATADVGGQVRVTAHDQKGHGVRVEADSGGAFIRVQDGLGRDLVRLLADSLGASLRVRGEDGRELVRMDAGKGGFSLTVDSADAN
jgi:hypothetical protein